MPLLWSHDSRPSKTASVVGYSQNKLSMSCIGIDVGYANAVIAIARRGGIDVLDNEVSKRSTAAMVGFLGKVREREREGKPLALRLESERSESPVLSRLVLRAAACGTPVWRAADAPLDRLVSPSLAPPPRRVSSKRAPRLRVSSKRAPVSAPCLRSNAHARASAHPLGATRWKQLGCSARRRALAATPIPHTHSAQQPSRCAIPSFPQSTEPRPLVKHPSPPCEHSPP